MFIEYVKKDLLKPLGHLTVGDFFKVPGLGDALYIIVGHTTTKTTDSIGSKNEVICFHMQHRRQEYFKLEKMIQPLKLLTASFEEI